MSKKKLKKARKLRCASCVWLYRNARNQRMAGYCNARCEPRLPEDMACNLFENKAGFDVRWSKDL